jgi:carboxymethylenebutenolidase
MGSYTVKIQSREAILGPKRLGYDAGISCHGTRMLDFIGELKDVTAPVCIITQ